MRRKRIRTNVANINKLLFPFWLPDKNKIFPFFTANHLDGIRTRDPRLESHQGWHRTKRFFSISLKATRRFLLRTDVWGELFFQNFIAGVLVSCFRFMLVIIISTIKRFDYFLAEGYFSLTKTEKRERESNRERERVCVWEREGKQTNRTQRVNILNCEVREGRN